MVGSSPSRRGAHVALGRSPMSFGERRPHRRGLMAGCAAVVLLALVGTAVALAASGGPGGSATGFHSTSAHQSGGSGGTGGGAGGGGAGGGGAGGHQLTSQQGPPLRVVGTAP